MRRAVRSRLDFEENSKPSNNADLEIGAGFPATWSDRLGSLLRPGSLGRRWAMCEWFCSPVDAPFLQSGEFAAMVVAAGAEEGPLPRRRWKELRRMIGRPRRFSTAFIQTEHANMIKAREEEIGLRHRVAQDAWIRTGARLLAFHPKRREVAHAVSAGSTRGGVWVTFDDEKSKRCIPLADVMPAPLPPPPAAKFAPFTVEDLERMASLSALLWSKEACLDAITQLHDQAEAGKPVEQRDYAMWLLQLEEINRALVPALAAAVTPLMAVKAENASMEREAADIVAQQAGPFTSAALRALVLKCLQLCIAIRKALEARSQGAPVQAEARLQLHSALASLRPAEGSPATAPYREIETFVNSLFGKST